MLGRGLQPSGGLLPDHAGGGGTSNHNALSNLTTGDPHTQYALVDGTRAFTGAITVASDTDVTCVFGRAKFSSPASDIAYFSHFDNATTNNFCIRHNAAGATAINAKAGQMVSLGISASSVATWTSTYVEYDVNVSPSSAGGVTLGTDAKPFGNTFISGLIKWDNSANEQTTVGAAGAASALPANPTKYLKVVDSGGTTLVIPAYAAA